MSASDVYELETLKTLDGPIKHNDPFDRLLIAQSLANELSFITCDEKIKLYDLPNIRV